MQREDCGSYLPMPSPMGHEEAVPGAVCHPDGTFSVSILIVQWQPVVMGWLALVKLLGFFSLNVESHQSCQKSQLASMTSYSCHRQPTWRFYLKQSCYGTFCIKLVTFQGNAIDPREDSRNGVCAM